MKQNIILWTSAILITFLFGYFNSVTNNDFPISGTIGIDGQKVTYKFEKVYGIDENKNNNYEIFIRTDNKNLSGRIEWQNVKENNSANNNKWNVVKLNYDEQKNYLIGIIPEQKPLTEIEYKVFIEYYNREQQKNITKQIPSDTILRTEFIGFVPYSISSAFWFTMYFGLVLAVRIALEFFSKINLIKKFTLFAVIAFVINGLVLNPLKITYELNAVGKEVLPLGTIYPLKGIALSLLWILIMVLIFNAKKIKEIALGSGIVTLILFLILY